MQFQFDAFLAYNSADKPQVRRLADRLRGAGQRVWFDEWIIQPGDDIYLAIERGLEASRTLVLCLSQAALGSDWVGLERSTVLFRDPANAGRRFIPLLLTDCRIPDTLRRYRYVDYRAEAEAAFKELLNGICALSELRSNIDSWLSGGQEDLSGDRQQPLRAAAEQTSRETTSGCLEAGREDRPRLAVTDNIQIDRDRRGCTMGGDGLTLYRSGPVDSRVSCRTDTAIERRSRQIIFSNVARNITSRSARLSLPGTLRRVHSAGMST